MRRSWLHSVVAVWVASSIVAQGCRGPGPTTPIAKVKQVEPLVPPAAIASTERPTVALTTPTGTTGQVELQVVAAKAAPTSPPITAMSQAETDALLARLEPLPDLTQKPAPIVRPPATAPVRQTPATPIAFVAPNGKQIADAPVSRSSLTPAPEPLAEPEIYPTGEVRFDSTVRVRFAEPMVPVASVGANAAKPPATIVPAVAGTWRWLDTHVAELALTTGRFAMATEFTVTVAAGTRAVSGATLAKDVVGKFATGGPRLERAFPERLRSDSPIALVFDQDVDPAAIAPFLDVTTTTEARPKPKLVKHAFTVTTLAEARVAWAKNPSLHVPDDLESHPGRLVVIAPKTAWPFDATLTAAVNAGAPSREGPRTASSVSVERVVVVPKFTVLGLLCGEIAKPRVNPGCPAGYAITLELSNRIDPAHVTDEMIQIAGAKVVTHRGASRELRFTAPAGVGKTGVLKLAPTGIVDEYGQALDNPHDLTFVTTKPPTDTYSASVSTHGEGMYILDPRFAIPQWVVDVQAIGALRLELYRAEPSDWFAYEEYEAGTRTTPPGKKVFDKRYEVGGNFGGQLRQDLGAALDPKTHTGHVIAIASPIPARPKQELVNHAWIQVTKLGVTARYDGEAVNAWVDGIAPDASFLHPVAGVNAALVVRGRTDVPAPVATDADGHARFALPERLPRVKKPGTTDDGGDDDDDDSYRGRHRWHAATDALVVARAGSDSVFSTIGASQKAVRHEFARWYVTDDRFTYKPGEPVYVKGWLRWTHDGVDPGIRTQGSGSVDWSLVDRRGQKLASGTTAISDQGGFDLEAAIPVTAQLGTARFTFSTAIPGRPKELDSYSHDIAIEEFRTPAYAVDLNDDVAHAGAIPLVAGESIEMAASARYYGGGGLGGAKVRWNVSLRPSQYRPPGWDGFSFRPPSVDRDALDREERAQLSAQSESNLVIAIPAVPVHQPAILAVDATVTDVDRQTIRASSRNILVHPSADYVGVRVRPGSSRVEGADLEFVVTDVDGKPVANVAIDVAIEGTSERENAEKQPIDHQHCKLTSATAPVQCAYTRKDINYTYRAVATIADARGRANTTEFAVPWWAPPADEPFAISADKPTYRVGDVAKLTVRSVTVPASAVVTFARQGVIREKRLDLVAEKTTVELPIEPTYVENVHVIVDRWTKRSSQLDSKQTKPLPDHDSVSIDLPVELDSVRLDMTARSLAKVVEPGGQASFEVTVMKDGKPVENAEVALLAVDEAVLSLSNRVHEDPLPRFYDAVEEGTEVVETMSLVADAGEDLDGKPGWERWDLATRGFGLSTGGGSGAARGHSSRSPSVVIGSPSAVQARKDFRATAVFSPRLHTDAAGKATVTVKMPESLTRFRIVALATAKDRWFGKAEGTIATQLPINARTVAPRFLTQGDRFGLPVIVQNLDRAPRTVAVAVRAANLATTGVAGKRVTLAAGQRAEVRFEVATVARGAAAIQTIVSSDATAAVDASTVAVQVYEPATTESFATYGIVDDKPAFEQLAVPSDIYPEVGGVEAEVSSTQLQSLTDAYWYVYGYPYECAEQRSARMLAGAAMQDLLDAFATPGRPTRAQIAETRTRDVAKLVKDQNDDGGWNFYRGMKSDPFITQQVLAALSTGKDAGAAVASATAYVTRDLDTRLARLEASAKLSIAQRKARDNDPYDVGVVAAELATVRDTGRKAIRLHAAAVALDAYPIDAKARVLSLIAKQPKFAAARAKLLVEVLGAVHETAASATIVAKFVEAERLLFVSNTRTTALALDALIREAPEHPVIAKLARGVLDARTHGRWSTTQDNLVVLQTMHRYFDTYEKVTPNYTGKLWFGTAAYAEQAFAGHSNARGRVTLDWPTLGLGKTHDLALDKVGPGRMYYRVGITYAPKQVDLPPLDAGFVVRRTYAGIDDPHDVALTNGVWHVKLGARVAVQLEVINTTRREVVGLADPLPAAFEPVNTRLANAERAVAETDDSWTYTTLRDNRAEAFASSLAEGSHHFTYTVRVTTPGTFLAAPAKAEEMYAPETFGRSSGTTVIVE